MRNKELICSLICSLCVIDKIHSYDFIFVANQCIGVFFLVHSCWWSVFHRNKCNNYFYYFYFTLHD